MLEWLPAMCSHVPKLGRAQPGRGEQMVRYYGYYSNVLRHIGIYLEIVL
ncbi:MAG: hypothetical protein KAS98_14890 [Deltaproteobacteria bacterium]|nr:hypothetical protein [Deltaproteobacteria bacterium]